jgi:hypothetical protein
MSHYHNNSPAGFQDVDDAEGETPQEHPPSADEIGTAMLGEAGDAIEGPLDFVDEVCPEPGRLAIVTARSRQ